MASRLFSSLHSPWTLRPLSHSRSGSMGRGSSSSGGGTRSVCLRSGGMKLSLICVCVMLLLSSVPHRVAGKMDISAYEYRRKFGSPLEMGGCPTREVKIDFGNGSHDWSKEICNFQMVGNVQSMDRELNDTRNVVIPTANDIIFYLGLCEGDAASYLGILNKGDCVAIEIANKLLFNEKTVVRAYVEYYRKSLDILNVTSRPPSEFNHHYQNKFYLQNRSYGTIEVVLVQFRFRSVQSARVAKEISLNSLLMSDYMTAMEQEIEIPQQTTIIRLSTAEAGDYSLRKFKPPQYREAVRHCQLLESDIRHTRDLIASGSSRPHLKYTLFPFKPPSDPAPRIIDPVTWEKTSMLEVSLRQSIRVGRRANKRCKRSKAKTVVCRRVRGLNRKLREILKTIHGGRTRWLELTPAQRHLLAHQHTADVTRYDSAMRRLAQDVRKELKQQRLQERLRRRKNRNTTHVRGPPNNKVRIRRLRMLQQSRRNP